jgi:hypothetical protein
MQMPMLSHCTTHFISALTLVQSAAVLQKSEQISVPVRWHVPEVMLRGDTHFKLPHWSVVSQTSPARRPSLPQPAPTMTKVKRSRGKHRRIDVRLSVGSPCRQVDVTRPLPQRFGRSLRCTGPRGVSRADKSKKPGRTGLTCVAWSGRRDLNPRRPPWQGGTLPLSYSRRISRTVLLRLRERSVNHRSQGRRG